MNTKIVKSKDLGHYQTIIGGEDIVICFRIETPQGYVDVELPCKELGDYLRQYAKEWEK
jgi:hypothetical protein